MHHKTDLVEHVRRHDDLEAEVTQPDGRESEARDAVRGVGALYRGGGAGGGDGGGRGGAGGGGGTHIGVSEKKSTSI